MSSAIPIIVHQFVAVRAVNLVKKYLLRAHN
jgi:hypothetical protein